VIIPLQLPCLFLFPSSVVADCYIWWYWYVGWIGYACVDDDVYIVYRVQWIMNCRMGTIQHGSCISGAMNYCMHCPMGTQRMIMLRLHLPLLSRLMQLLWIGFHPIPSHPIRPDPIQSNPIQPNIILSQLDNKCNIIYISLFINDGGGRCMYIYIYIYIHIHVYLGTIRLPHYSCCFLSYIYIYHVVYCMVERWEQYDK